MKKFFLILALAFLPQLAFAGSQTFSTPGTYTFTVPNYKTLTVEVWGGGGGGGGSWLYRGGLYGYPGSAGGDSSFNGLIVAGGGGGGQVGSSAAGVGGTAGGGDTNIDGNPGGRSHDAAYGGAGGSAPNGGAGALEAGSPYVNFAAGFPGQSPGGGGGGGGGARVPVPDDGGQGGGSGAYAEKAYASGALHDGSSITVVVGQGGAGGASQYNITAGTTGGAGGDGRVSITWIEPNCSASADLSSDNHGFRALAGILNRWINKLGFSFCISNASGLNYFVPARTQAELQSFYDAIPRLSGVSQQAP